MKEQAKGNKIFLIVVMLIFFALLLLYINQCKTNCNCANESICPKSCETILSLLNDDCPYDDGFKELIIEEKYVSEFENDKECKVDSDCIVIGDDCSCYEVGCYNNTHKIESSMGSGDIVHCCNNLAPKTCLCKNNVCIPVYK